MTDARNAPEVPYREWVDLAFAHLMNAVDTAMDELQRDRDFLDDDDAKGLASPEGTDRHIAIELAIARFVREVEGSQES